MFASITTRWLKPSLLAATFAASLTLFGCNTTATEEALVGDGVADMTYDGKAWEQQTGICPGTTEYTSSFTITNGDDSRVLYIQSKTFPVAGTYTVTRGVNHPDSLATGQIAVSISDLNFNFVNATGGILTITNPSSSTFRFEGASVTFDNGKVAAFDVTATFGCSK